MTRGSHQFQRPIRRMAAGTMTSLTIVASMAMATAVANPNCWTVTSGVTTKAANIVAISTAAPDISGAVSTSP